MPPSLASTLLTANPSSTGSSLASSRSWPNLPSAGHQGGSNAGAFLRLEQHWKETHVAYLQHRSTVVTSSLGVPRGAAARPGSAASVRSSRLMRVAR